MQRKGAKKGSARRYPPRPRPPAKGSPRPEPRRRSPRTHPAPGEGAAPPPQPRAERPAVRGSMSRRCPRFSRTRAARAHAPRSPGARRDAARRPRWRPSSRCSRATSRSTGTSRAPGWPRASRSGEKRADSRPSPRRFVSERQRERRLPGEHLLPAHGHGAPGALLAGGGCGARACPRRDRPRGADRRPAGARALAFASWSSPGRRKSRWPGSFSACGCGLRRGVPSVPPRPLTAQ